MPNLLKKYFSEADLEAVSQAIREAEARTSGEIRVEIRQRRRRREKGMSVEEIARREFEALGMTRTRDRNSVLLFLLLEDHELQVLADVNAYARLDPQMWRAVADRMAERFRQQEYREGVVEAVGSIGTILADNFPRKSDDANELPDEVRIS